MEDLAKIIKVAQRRKDALVIGTDSNAYTNGWGNRTNNELGGLRSFFIHYQRTGSSAITLTRPHTETYNCKVLDKRSFSDRNDILCSVNLKSS